MGSADALAHVPALHQPRPDRRPLVLGSYILQWRAVREDSAKNFSVLFSNLKLELQAKLSAASKVIRNESLSCRFQGSVTTSKSSPLQVRTSLAKHLVKDGDRNCQRRDGVGNIHNTWAERPLSCMLWVAWHKRYSVCKKLTRLAKLSIYLLYSTSNSSTMGNHAGNSSTMGNHSIRD